MGRKCDAREYEATPRTVSRERGSACMKDMSGAKKIERDEACDGEATAGEKQIYKEGSGCAKTSNENGDEPVRRAGDEAYRDRYHGDLRHARTRLRTHVTYFFETPISRL